MTYESKVDVMGWNDDSWSRRIAAATRATPMGTRRGTEATRRQGLASTGGATNQDTQLMLREWKDV